MKTLLFTIQASLYRLLFGSSCAGCHTPGPAICPTCLNLIPFSDTTEHPSIYGIYDYGNPLVSHAIWNLKYRHSGQEAKILATNAVGVINEILGEYLQSEKEQEVTLVPIPQYKTKTQTRGFNQSEIIASWIQKMVPSSQVEKVLQKISETIPQSHLSDKKDRMKNISGAMQATKQLDSKKVHIIIDDVTTTGATFLEAMRALKAGGASNILCVALAHGYKRK